MYCIIEGIYKLFSEEGEETSEEEKYVEKKKEKSKVIYERAFVSDRLSLFRRVIEPSSATEFESERLKFVKKVYGILSMQLCMITLMCLLSNLSTNVKLFIINYIYIEYLMIFISLVTCIALNFIRNLSREVPKNYILLGAFTFAESYIIAYICSIYDPETVLIAAILTLGVVLTLTGYAFNTKTDFTNLSTILYVLLILLIMAGFIAIIFRSDFLYTIYCACGALLFAVYIIMDTQMIAGGGSRKIDLDDYILGAMMLYLDYINLFIKIVHWVAKIMKDQSILNQDINI